MGGVELRSRHAGTPDNVADGEENNPFSSGYVLAGDDWQVINALRVMWQKSLERGRDLDCERMDLEIEEGKPLGEKNYRDIAINSTVLESFERESETEHEDGSDKI